MSIGFFNVPTPKNEPILGYAPNSKERVSLKAKLAEMKSQVIEVPMFIGSEELKEGNKLPLTSPHDHQHVLGYYYEGDASHVNKAIDTALAAREKWANMSWEHRVSIFLKAADLSASKYRMELNAATMLGQSKNAFQAEIDAACELIDFLRFNVHFLSQIYLNHRWSLSKVVFDCLLLKIESYC